jgi:glycosyltransferase involved in cell wall biosynthesis
MMAFLDVLVEAGFVVKFWPYNDEVRVAASLQPDAAVGVIAPYFFDQFAVARRPPATREIIFIAGFGHPPNEDAAVWFATAILPLIQAEVPAAHLSIIGSNPTDRVRGLAADGVAVFANVTDVELAAAYGRARVAVVPLRCGAGVKLKTVEALRAGTPLVTTTVGAQGLSGLSSVAAVQDDPAAFAAAVVALLRNDTAWEGCCRRQIDYARQRFSREILAASLLCALMPTLPDHAAHGWMAAE